MKFNKKMKGYIASLVQEETNNLKQKAESEEKDTLEIAAILKLFAGGKKMEQMTATESESGSDANAMPTEVKLNSMLKKKKGKSAT